MSKAVVKLNLNAEEINKIAVRLGERADQITMITSQDLALDLRLASRICDKLTHIRAEVAQIAGRCTDKDAARELRDMLDDAERS